MTPAERLAKIVRAKNKKLDEEAKAEFTIGAVFAVLVLGACFVGAFVLGYIMADRDKSVAFMGYGVPITLALAGIASLVAWQTVQPKRKILPMDDPEEIAAVLAGGTPAALFFTPKHEMPGMVGFIFGGPENLFKGWGIMENKVSTDPALLERSMKLLKRCEEGYPLSRMKNPEAAVLLRQLSLVRVERRDSGQTLVFTDEGRRLNEQV